MLFPGREAVRTLDAILFLDTGLFAPLSGIPVCWTGVLDRGAERVQTRVLSGGLPLVVMHIVCTVLAFGLVPSGTCRKWHTVEVKLQLELGVDHPRLRNCIPSHTIPYCYIFFVLRC